MRVGIIGTGWGRMHVGGFRGAGAEVTALCGRDPARTRDVAAREGFPLATTDVNELCDAVDVVERLVRGSRPSQTALVSSR